MKMYIISNMYPDNSSPSYGIFVKNFVVAMEEEGIEISEASLITGKRGGVFKFFQYLIFFLDIIFKSNFGKYDLIYVHFVKHSLFPLNFWWRKKGKKLVLNAHGTDVLGKGKVADLFRWMNSDLMESANLVVIPSEFFIPKIQSLGVKKENIFISASGGINPKIFFPSIGKKNLSGVIGYFGRLDSGKGLYTLLSAFSSLEIGIGIRLEIIGGGSLTNELLDFCVSKGINDRVDFKGVLSQKDSSKIIREWDLLIFPSELEESLGLVGLEAMACGVPVIGSCIGGITTYLENNKNGFTFAHGNSEELKEKVRAFYRLDNALKLELSKNAYRTSKRYRTKKISKRLSQKLESLAYG